MLPQSACQPWYRDPAAQPAKEHRTYTTSQDMIARFTAGRRTSTRHASREPSPYALRLPDLLGATIWIEMSLKGEAARIRRRLG